MNNFHNNLAKLILSLFSIIQTTEVYFTIIINRQEEAL